MHRMKLRSQLLHYPLVCWGKAEMSSQPVCACRLGRKSAYSVFSLPVAFVSCPLCPADTLIMYQVPSSSDVAGRRALRRLQEVSRTWDVGAAAATCSCRAVSLGCQLMCCRSILVSPGSRVSCVLAASVELDPPSLALPILSAPGGCQRDCAR